MPAAKEQIRQIIAENDNNSVADVYILLKVSFKDILQELMEAELNATLGYQKNQKGGIHTDNKRNGHSPKNLKSQYGEFQIDVPRDRNGQQNYRQDPAPGQRMADTPIKPGLPVCVHGLHTL